MRRKLKVIALSLFVSMSVAGCGNSTSASVTTNTVTTTSPEAESAPEEKESSNGLLPFGFTPKEFHGNFANFASFSNITTDDLQELSSTSGGFLAHSSSGDEIFLLLLSDSNGKVISISMPTKDVKKDSFLDFMKATLSATDMRLDFKKLDAILDFNNIPRTINEIKTCDNNGIYFYFGGGGFDITRSADTPDEYSYTKIHSNPKNEAEAEPSLEILPAPTSVVDITQSISPEVAIGQKNALSKALDYLNYSAFSHSGLIDQLEYEGFTSEEATYAADNCGANWSKQAAKKALDYLSYSAFSYSGLIKQLEYEGFSTEEATFAVDSCGADWNEQAAKKAQDYLDYSSFSRSGLIDQLKYEGFTNEQAEYGASAAGY